DVSKSKSTVAALGFGKELIFKPFNIYHVKNDVNKLINKIKSLGSDVISTNILAVVLRYH
ncbi:MAG: hypothetical protein E7C03_01355, partial [Anaerococcus sp.]|nr:hypothetical protein [Anaerococcus sp.]